MCSRRSGEDLESEVVVCANSYLEEYHEATMNPKVSRTPDAAPQRWPPLPLGTLAVNVDAAIPDHGQSFRVGGVSRDHDGKIVLSRILFVRRGFSPQQAEATSILNGLHAALETG